MGEETRRRVTGRVLGTLITFLSQGSAFGDEYHVDAAHGSDQKGNGSRAAPWRTLTKALGSIPPPVPEKTTTLLVGPGLHDPALGEVFPLQVPPGVSILGAGWGRTVIAGTAEGRRGAGRPAEVLLDYLVGSPGRPPERGELGGVTLTGARHAVRIRDGAGEGPAPVLRRLRLTLNGIGVAIEDAEPLIEECWFTENQTGVHMGALAADRLGAVIRRCLIEKNTQGINATNTRAVTIEANHLQRNAIGVMLGAFTYPVITRPFLLGNLLVENGVGIWSSGIMGGTCHAVITNCTLYRNEVGISSSGTAAYGLSHPRITNTIVWKSLQVDLYGVGLDSISHSIFETRHGGVPPPLPGRRGNLALDPRFRDPDGGDFHLEPGSPALDAGDPEAWYLPAVDWDGEPRSVGYPDIGIDEWSGFLRAEGPAQLGGALRLRLLSPRDPWTPCVVGLSLSRSPGIQVEQRTIPLAFDALLVRSLLPGAFLEHPVLLLDQGGTAEAALALPAHAGIAGLTFYAAFVTFSPSPSPVIRSISNAIELRMGR